MTPVERSLSSSQWIPPRSLVWLLFWIEDIEDCPFPFLPLKIWIPPKSLLVCEPGATYVKQSPPLKLGKELAAQLAPLKRLHCKTVEVCPSGCDAEAILRSYVMA